MPLAFLSPLKNRTSELPYRLLSLSLFITVLVVRNSIVAENSSFKIGNSTVSVTSIDASHSGRRSTVDIVVYTLFWEAGDSHVAIWVHPFFLFIDRVR